MKIIQMLTIGAGVLGMAVSCGAKQISFADAFNFVKENYINASSRNQPKTQFVWDASRCTGNAVELAKEIIKYYVPGLTNPPLKGQQTLYDRFVSYPLNEENFKTRCPNDTNASFYLDGKKLIYKVDQDNVVQSTIKYTIHIENKYNDEGYIEYEKYLIDETSLDEQSLFGGIVEVFSFYK